MTRVRAFSHSLAALLGRHPVVPVAIKTAVAAVLAWLLAQPLGGPVDTYAYYAPLGAVVTISSRLADSLRSSIEAVLAIALGAMLAVGARLAPTPGLLALALAVGVGTLLGAWRRVGSMSSWVPISAMFILIVGGPHPATYVFAYLGLTALGAAVGIVVNLIAPPMPLLVTDNVQASLRDLLADQLEGLADGLDRDPLPTQDEWRTGESQLADQTRRAEQLMSQTLSSSQMNWRVRRHRDAAKRQQDQGQALTQLTFLVQEMTALLAHQEHDGRSTAALGRELRPAAGDSFRAVAEALRSVRSTVAADDEFEAATCATDAFADAIRDLQAGGDGDTFAAGGLVTAIRRVLMSIAPEEQSDEVDSV